MLLGLPDSLGLPLHGLGFSGTPALMEASSFLESYSPGGSHSLWPPLTLVLSLWGLQVSQPPDFWGSFKQLCASPTPCKPLLCEPPASLLASHAFRYPTFLGSSSLAPEWTSHTNSHWSSTVWASHWASLPMGCHSLCFSLPFGLGLIILWHSTVWQCGFCLFVASARPSLNWEGQCWIVETLPLLFARSLPC